MRNCVEKSEKKYKWNERQIQTRSDGESDLFSFCHDTTGAGDPVTGTSTRIGSPALTRISLPASLLRSTFGASANTDVKKVFKMFFLNKKRVLTFLFSQLCYYEKTLANNSSYIEPKETGFIGVLTEQWLKKYLHNLFIKLCLFRWQTVYRHFWSLVYWWTLKLESVRDPSLNMKFNVSLAIWDHSVTFYPTQVNSPA